MFRRFPRPLVGLRSRWRLSGLRRQLWFYALYVRGRAHFMYFPGTRSSVLSVPVRGYLVTGISLRPISISSLKRKIVLKLRGLARSRRWRVLINVLRRYRRRKVRWSPGRLELLRSWSGKRNDKRNKLMLYLVPFLINSSWLLSLGLLRGPVLAVVTCKDLRTKVHL
jgi:hypothetical protein